MEAIYMSPNDAAKRYGICRCIVYELLRMNEAPQTIKVGNRRLIPIREMDAFMASFTTKGVKQ